MEAKKAATMSSMEAPKKHGWNKFKSWFGRKSEKDMGYFSQTSEKMDPSEIDIDLSQIMKARQENFFNVVRKTIEAILNEPTPFLLNQMMRFFHEKLEKTYLNRHDDPDSINTSKHEESILSQMSQSQLSFHS